MNNKNTPVFSHALPAGFQLLQYDIEKVLGQGGFGLTYLAHDRQLKRTVAIKECFVAEIAVRELDGKVRPRSSLDEKMVAWGLDRFLQEAQTLARFKHPNLVQVLNFFEANNTAYMVMEYEQGESLTDWIKQRRPLSYPLLLALVEPLLGGLKALHLTGFIHRDIKPSNIYIRDSDNSPVLLDFGSARHAMGEQTKTMTTLLTPGYAPFEQYYSDSKRQGPWTDIYALSAVLYWVLAGNPPLHATDRSSALLQNKTDPNTSAVNIGGAQYPLYFLQAIDQALNILENDRPQNVDSWRKLLQPKAQQANQVSTAMPVASEAEKLISAPDAPHSGQTEHDRTVVAMSQDASTSVGNSLDPALFDALAGPWSFAFARRMVWIWLLSMGIIVVSKFNPLVMLLFFLAIAVAQIQLANKQVNIGLRWQSFLLWCGLICVAVFVATVFAFAFTSKKHVVLLPPTFALGGLLYDMFLRKHLPGFPKRRLVPIFAWGFGGVVGVIVAMILHGIIKKPLLPLLALAFVVAFCGNYFVGKGLFASWKTQLLADKIPTRKRGFWAWWFERPLLHWKSLKQK